MRRHHVVLVAVFMLIAAHALAQAAPRTPKTAQTGQTPQSAQTPQTPQAPPPPPPPAPAPPVPHRDGQPINIRVDTTISETGGNAAPVKKTVTAVAGDGFDASVRETANNAPPLTPGPFAGPTVLNVDASPTILPNGKIRVRVTMQYAAGQAPAGDARARTDIRQTLVLILDSGKPLVISEASDPISDRQVTVQVTATILK
jgi:hypothetical protein